MSSAIARTLVRPERSSRSSSIRDAHPRGRLPLRHARHRVDKVRRPLVRVKRLPLRRRRGGRRAASRPVRIVRGRGRWRGRARDVPRDVELDVAIARRRRRRRGGGGLIPSTQLRRQSSVVRNRGGGRPIAATVRAVRAAGDARSRGWPVDGGVFAVNGFFVPAEQCSICAKTRESL